MTMANPGGNYPGRQIFLGSLITGEDAFAYFGSGRSAASQARYATNFIPGENSVRIKPTSPDEKFDPFRHYQAVRIDPESGLAVISNSQAPVDALVEAYKFIPEWEGWAATSEEWYTGAENFAEILLHLIGPEYDNRLKPTSRVVGIIRPLEIGTVYIIGNTSHLNTSRAISFQPESGEFRWVSTYDGEVDYSNFDPSKLGDTHFATAARSARELTNE